MQPLIQTKATLICRYPIASSDMYYSEVGQRDVYVRDDLVHGFQIWGQLTGTGEETAISLCEIFLEYLFHIFLCFAFAEIKSHHHLCILRVCNPFLLASKSVLPSLSVRFHYSIKLRSAFRYLDL